MEKLQVFTVKTKKIGDRRECVFVSVSMAIACFGKKNLFKKAKFILFFLAFFC